MFAFLHQHKLVVLADGDDAEEIGFHDALSVVLMGSMHAFRLPEIA